LVWCLSDLLIAYHLNVRIGLSARLTGMILFGSFILGAGLDILVATWVARMGSPLRNTLLLQAIAGCAAVLAALALFWPTPRGGEAACFVYLCLASVLFRTAYSVLDVTQNALTSLLPQRVDEVRSYVAVRTIVSSLGRLAASFLVFLAMGAATDPFADFKVILVIVAPVMISVIGLSRAAMPTTFIDPPGVEFRWLSLPYRRLAIPLVVMICHVGLLGLVTRLIPLLRASGQEAPTNSSLIVTMVCGTVVGPLLLSLGVPDAVDRRSAAVSLPLVTAIVSAGLLMPLPGMWPLVLAFILGAGSMALTNLIWERVAWIVRQEASTSGVRIDIGAFALLTACIQIGIAISNVFLGSVLDGLKSGVPSSFITTVIIIAAGGVMTAVGLGTRAQPSKRFDNPSTAAIS
jgi:Na+/melibiose symporter-like transporter